jgi:NADPH-dependent 2,4-dienoyl-CoA reductase/sulfur reductase-like enzyme/rhodanese-related sulfurtransferase
VEKSDFVIVGGVAAGPKTASTLVRRIPDARVTLFHKDEHLSYAVCGLPFLASGDVGSFRELKLTPYGVERNADFFKGSRGFDAITGALVKDIHRERNTVTVEVAKSGEVFEHGYGKLVLATGAVPREPSFTVAASERIRSFQKPADAASFRELAEQGMIERAVIIGGGLVGCELAEAVGGMWGIEVTLIEKENQLLPYVLDPEMSAIVQRQLVAQGTHVLTGSKVESIDIDDKGNPVVLLQDRSKEACDYVFLAMGLQPEVSLARQCGLQLGHSGGIKVNRKMQTSDPDIYAGGDCVESIHQITGEELFISMGSLANRHGRVIAENLAGDEVEFPGVLGTFFLRVFDMNIGTVGLSVAEAVKAGFRARAVWGTFPDGPDYLPEMKTFVLKMVYSDDDGTLLGLQGVGQGDVYHRVDVFASFLQRKARVEDIFDLEHGHYPTCSEALDPLHHMAGIARAQQRGTCFINPGSDLADGQPEDVLVLDVREKEEAVNKPLPSRIVESIPNIVNIPLNELSCRLQELEHYRKIVVVCQRGSRSYQATLMLKSAGFKRVDVLAGGLQTQW